MHNKKSLMERPLYGLRSKVSLKNAVNDLFVISFFSHAWYTASMGEMAEQRQKTIRYGKIQFAIEKIL